MTTSKCVSTKEKSTQPEDRRFFLFLTLSLSVFSSLQEVTIWNCNCVKIHMHVFMFVTLHKFHAQQHSCIQCWKVTGQISVCSWVWAMNILKLFTAYICQVFINKISRNKINTVNEIFRNFPPLIRSLSQLLSYAPWNSW